MINGNNTEVLIIPHYFESLGRKTRFPDRVRFNWGYHDGADDINKGRGVRFSQHYDSVYLAGYKAGVSDFINNNYHENSDVAWASNQP